MTQAVSWNANSSPKLHSKRLWKLAKNAPEAFPEIHHSSGLNSFFFCLEGGYNKEEGLFTSQNCKTTDNTVDGQNPAPPRMMIIPRFYKGFNHPWWLAGFRPSTEMSHLFFDYPGLCNMVREVAGCLREHLLRAPENSRFAVWKMGVS